jgi:3-deoxy-manno-octulosonate cytidylyltransferase (CMP-KDO synthetase)
LNSQSEFRIVGVIPARLGSTRLPRKVLRTLAGRPLIEWVYRAAKASSLLDYVVVATDSEEVLEACRSRKIEVRLTSPNCASGSDRVYEVSQAVKAEIYVNIQGDEPLLQPEHIEALLSPFGKTEAQVTTLSVPCSAEDVTNPNVVKVVTGIDGRALYFSRAAIPYDRDNSGFTGYRKHLGLYAYRKKALERFSLLPASQLEQIEKLEQLRLLENGISLYVAESPTDTIGVDTEKDLLAAEAQLLKKTII